MNLLELMIEVGVNDKASSGLDKIVGNVKSTAEKLSTGFKTALDVGTKITTVAAGAFAALGGAALNATGELEQNSGGLLQVFKENAGEMEAVAKSAYGNMGLSASGFMGTANQIGALLQGSGFGIAESATLAADVMQRAADVASIMGIDISRAMESITGAAKGNFSMMDNLGVAINDTTIAQYALSKGITTSTREMTTQQKVGLAMELFMEKSAYAAGNYARENETLAGSLNTAKAALNNFLSGAGSAGDAGTAIANTAKVITKNLQEIIPALTAGFKELAGAIVPEISGIMEAAVPAIVDGAKTLLKSAAEVLPDLVNIVLESLPGMISGLQEVGTALIESAKEIVGNLMTAFTDAFKDATGIELAPLIDSITLAITTLQEAFSGIMENVDWEAVTTVINGALTTIAGAITTVITAMQGEAFQKFVGTIKDFFNSMKGGLQTILTPVAEGVKKLFAAFTGGDLGLVQSIADAFGSFAKWFEGNLAPAIATAATAIADLLEPFAEGVGTLITEIGDALGKVFQYATEGKASPLQRIADSFQKLVDAFKPALSEIITNVATAIGNLFVALGQGVVEKLESFANALERGDGFLQNMITHIGDVATKFSEFLLELTNSDATVEEKLGKLGEVFGTAFVTIKEDLGAALDFVKEKFNDLKSFIENFDLSEAVDKFVEKCKKALETLQEWWAALQNGAEKGYEEQEAKIKERKEAQAKEERAAKMETVTVPYEKSHMGMSDAAIANTIIQSATQTPSRESTNEKTEVVLQIGAYEVGKAVLPALNSISKQRGTGVLTKTEYR